jgi:hypothetical protein
LGEDWTQKKISLLEAKEEIEPALLDQVSKVLKLPKEAIENFTEAAAYNVIGNVVTSVNDNATGQIFQFSPSFNPLDKVVELYERMLKDKNEMIERLERILGDRK